jgi:ATP-dependent 26S proteasome regulatory subunit
MLRASDYCRPSDPNESFAVLFSISASFPFRDDDEPYVVWASTVLLRKARLISGRLIELEYKDRRVIARILVKDIDSVDDDADNDILEVSPLVAANLGLFFNNEKQSANGSFKVKASKLPIAKSVLLRYWGKPVKPRLFSSQRRAQENERPTTSEWPLPPVHRLLRTGAIVTVQSNGHIYTYEVRSVNDNAAVAATVNDETYESNGATKYSLESPPKGARCPRLPPFISHAYIPHPNAKELTDTLQMSPGSAAHSILHVIGDIQQDVRVAVETAAARVGRRYLPVQGLASFAFLHGRSISTGGLVDKLSGLDAAIEQAFQHSPCVLHIYLDGEFSTNDREQQNDEEGRIWSLLCEELTLINGAYYSARNLSDRATVPLWIVLSTKSSLLPGPLLHKLMFDSIETSFPSTEYIDYLWAHVDCDHPNIGALLSVRPANEIRQLAQAFTDSLEQVEDEQVAVDPIARLQQLCAKMDKERRTTSGLARIPSVQWEDVGGLEHVRREIMDTIELPLQHPHLFKAGRSGILLYGPPGSGKTLVAKAVATECNLPFLSIKGPELLGSYVGESEANVRNVFDQARQLAKQNQPPASVLFFDELDSLAPRRGDQASGGNVMDRVVATLFSELDKKEDDCTVFCMGATNRPDLLDPSLLRPGRLDRLVYLGIAAQDRTSILVSQMRKLRLAEDPEAMAAAVVARISSNLTGADLSTIVSNALLRATERLCNEADAEVACRRSDGSDDLCTLDQVLESWSVDRLTPVVTRQDLLDASNDVVASVSAEELLRYDELKKKF